MLFINTCQSVYWNPCRRPYQLGLPWSKL